MKNVSLYEKRAIITTNPNLKVMKWCYDSGHAYFWLSSKSVRSTSKKVLKLRKQVARLKNLPVGKFENVSCLSTIWIKNMKSTNNKTVFDNISEFIYRNFDSYMSENFFPSNLSLKSVPYVVHTQNGTDSFAEK